VEIVGVAGADRGEAESSELPVAVVAHGGVIRSILAGLTGTPLIDSFKVFALHYGCVIRIGSSPGGLIHSVVSNQAPAEREQHKPSSFYK
jgi:alpha-ribazole phosphatase